MKRLSTSHILGKPDTDLVTDAHLKEALARSCMGVEMARRRCR